MHRDNFTMQTLQNFSAVSRRAGKWLVGSQIDTFKFVFKTDILMTYASFCKSAIQPFPCPNTIRLSLKYKDIYIRPNRGSIYYHGTAALLHSRPASPTSRDICSAQDSDTRNALYMYRTETYMTQQTVPVLVLFLLSFIYHY
jgi:hypothetical protein